MIEAIIYDYMKKIASSDGEVSSEEQILLNKANKANKAKKAFNF